jgi:hypothetical protein
MVDAMIEVVTAALFDLILAALTVLLAWIGSKIATNKKLANINAAKMEIDDAVFQTVAELQQTVVEGLKAASEDGKLTPEEISELSYQVLYKTLRKMSQPSIELLRAAGVDLEAYIQGAAEKWVASLKE